MCWEFIKTHIYDYCGCSNQDASNGGSQVSSMKITSPYGGVRGEWMSQTLIMYVTNLTNVANVASLPILTQTTIIFLNLNLILVPNPAKLIAFHTVNLVL